MAMMYCSLQTVVFALTLLTTASKSSIPQSQLNSLIDFYEATHGDSWTYPLLCIRKYPWNITEWKSNGFDCNKNWCGLTTSHPFHNKSFCQISGFGIQNFNASGSIPASIGNLTAVSTIAIRNNPLLIGNIPPTISKLSSLTGITVTDNGWMKMPNPNFLCNLSKLYQLTLSQITFADKTTFEDFDCIFSHDNYRFFALRDIKGLTGTLTAGLCNVTQDIQLYNIYDMSTSHIPQCLLLKDPDRNNKALQFSNIKLVGTIPDQFCNITYLNGLSLTNVSLTGTVPQCIFDMQSLGTLSLYHTQLSGTIHSITLSNVVALNLFNNDFEGSVTNIFNNSQFKSNTAVIQINIANNKFEDDDITELLRVFMTQFPGLLQLHFGGNERISGRLPDIESSPLQILTAQNSDLYGSISLWYFEHLKQFIAYRNRLSCQLPYTTMPYSNDSRFNASKFKIIVLPQNLFCTASDGLSQQIKRTSPFESASNLYVTYFESIGSFVVGIGAFIVLFVVILIHFIRLYQEKKQLALNVQLSVNLNEADLSANGGVRAADQVLKNLNDLQQPFMSVAVFCVIVALLIFYPLCSKYYQCSPFLFWFSACFYYSNSVNTKILAESIKDYILLILFMIFNFIICSIQYKYMKKYRAACTNEHELENKNEIIKDAESDSKCCSVIKCICLSFLYIVATFITVLYLISASLPNDNKWRLNHTSRYLVTYSISIALALNSLYIIPPMANTYLLLFCRRNVHKHSLRRNQITFILRTITTFLLPLIFSIVILNDCGAGWVKLWYPCINNYAQFDVVYENYSDDEIMWASSADNVCNLNAVTDINWNRCMRSYLYHWCYVMIIKMYVLMIMASVDIPRKIVQSYILKKMKICCCAKCACGSGTILINVNYIEFMNLLQSVIVFSFVAPLILPVTMMAIELRKYFYKIMRYKFKWKLKQNLRFSSLPISFLNGAIVGQQTFSVLFFYCCLNHDNILLAVTAALLVFVMDVSFVFVYVKCS